MKDLMHLVDEEMDKLVEELYGLSSDKTDELPGASFELPHSVKKAHFATCLANTGYLSKYGFTPHSICRKDAELILGSGFLC